MFVEFEFLLGLRGKLKQSCIGKRFLFNKKACQDVITEFAFVDLAPIESNLPLTVKYAFVKITFIFPIILENSSHLSIPMGKILAPVAIVKIQNTKC